MKSNVYIIEGLDDSYLDKQFTSLKLLVNLTDGYYMSTIVEYDLRQDPDKLGFDSITSKINYRSISTCSSLNIDELDDEITDYYRYFINEIEYVDELFLKEPYIIIIDGVDKIKPIYGDFIFDDFKEFLENKLTLLQMLNMYIICIK